MLKKYFSILWLLLILGCCSSFVKPAIADVISKEQVVDFANKELNVLVTKARSSTSEEFISFLKVEAEKFMAIRYMALWILGNNRTKFSDEQKEQFITIFSNQIINVYGKLAYQNRSKNIVLKQVTSESPGVYKISFVVDLSENQKLNIDWQARYSQKDHKLLVTDVILNGLSFIQTKRFEYNELFNNSNQNPEKFLEVAKSAVISSLKPKH